MPVNSKKSAKKVNAPALKKKKQPVAKKAVQAEAKQSRYDDEMTEAFIKEVTEDVKNDNLVRFWKKYGTLIIVAVVLIVSATVGFETIRNWRRQGYIQKTEQYMSTLSEPSAEQMLAQLEKIAGGNYGVYSELARIQITDILFDQGKEEDAMNMLSVMASNEELDPRICKLAAIKLAAHKVDVAPRAEIEALLKPVIDADDAWTPIAQEYIAFAAIKDGDKDTARDIYNALLQNGQISEEFRARIQDMLSALAE